MRRPPGVSLILLSHFPKAASFMLLFSLSQNMSEIIGVRRPPVASAMFLFSPFQNMSDISGINEPCVDSLILVLLLLLSLRKFWA